MAGSPPTLRTQAVLMRAGMEEAVVLGDGQQTLLCWGFHLPPWVVVLTPGDSSAGAQPQRADGGGIRPCGINGAALLYKVP